MGSSMALVVVLTFVVFAILLLSKAVDRVFLIKASVSIFAILFTVWVFFLDAPGIELLSIGYALSLWGYLLATLFYAEYSASDGSKLEYRIFSVTNVAVVIICTIMIYARAYYFEGIANCEEKSACHDFLSAIYFSIVTWTTLGYGDLIPRKEFYLTAASEALIGYVGMSIVIGIVTHKLTKFLD
jgi:Ion channel